ncbi:MAG: hypothetical protein N2423_06090, partial [Novosphingobium sp.]|nr:hypothetical protein [Novosphingobium sp.]
MTALAELNLYQLPMEDPAFSENPWPALEQARKLHPWLARSGFGYAVHEYQAMRDLLWLDRSMTGAYHDVVAIMQAEGTGWGRFQHESLLAQTGESHQRIRNILAPSLTRMARSCLL